MTLTPGATLQQNRYVIRDVLAQSDIGIAYLADHVHLEQLVRLESLNPARRGSDTFEAECQQMLQRARKLSRCRHRHLTRIIDAFWQDGVPYVGVEYPLGVSLADIVQTGKPLPASTALVYLQQVGSAVQLLHDHKLAHGNIQPQTVVRGAVGESEPMQGRSLLGQGVMLSALPLTSPALDSAFDAEATVQDVRSLAALLWFTLTAQPATPDLADRQVLAYRLGQVQFAPASASGLEDDLERIEAAIAQGLAATADHVLSVRDWLAMVPTITAEHLDVMAAAPSDASASPTPQKKLDSAIPQPSMHISKRDTSTSSTPFAPSGTGHSAMTSGSDQPTALQTPETPSTHLQSTTVLQPNAASLSPPMCLPKERRSRLPLLLGMTALAAGFAGAGAGAAIRLNPEALKPVRSDAALFNRNQDFPESQQWPGQSLSELDSTSGFLFEQPASEWTVPNRSRSYAPVTPPVLQYPDSYSVESVPSSEPTPELDRPEATLDTEPPSLDPQDSIPPRESGNVEPLVPENRSLPPIESPPVAEPPPAPLPMPEGVAPSTSLEPLNQTDELLNLDS